MPKLIFWLFLIISIFNFSLAQTSKSNYDKLSAELLFPTKFSEREVKFINSLSATDLEKLIRIIKLIMEKSLNHKPLNICTTDACKKQQLKEKCEKEKKQTSVVSSECRLLELGTLGELAKGLVGNPENKIDQAKLEAEKKRAQELKDEANALASGEKNTPFFNNQVSQAQQGKLPVYSDNVLNQTSLIGTPDFYDGKFVCNISNNGTYAGNERPRNQGGRVADSLFYGIANAAKASGAQVGSFGCFNMRNIAGTNTASKHSTGDACDVVLKGNDSRNTAFMVLFLANTGTHNTVGSYASRGFDHSHLGADCGGTWCPYQKGSGLEPWKALAFNAVFQACGVQFNPGMRPPKSWIQNCAKKAAETFCK